MKEICEFDVLEGLRSNIGACSPNRPTKLIRGNCHCPDEKGRKVEIQRISKRRQKGWKLGKIISKQGRCKAREVVGAAGISVEFLKKKVPEADLLDALRKATFWCDLRWA